MKSRNENFDLTEESGQLLGRAKTTATPRQVMLTAVEKLVANHPDVVMREAAGLILMSNLSDGEVTEHSALLDAGDLDPLVVINDIKQQIKQAPTRTQLPRIG